MTQALTRFVVVGGSLMSSATAECVRPESEVEYPGHGPAFLSGIAHNVEAITRSTAHLAGMSAQELVNALVVQPAERNYSAIADSLEKIAESLLASAAGIRANEKRAQAELRHRRN